MTGPHLPSAAEGLAGRLRAAKPVLGLPDAMVRVLAAHATALLATLLVLIADSDGERDMIRIAAGLTIVVAFSALRVATTTRRLASSTMVLDAIGSALLLAGTAAPASPYFFVGLAGAWWAAHVPTRRSVEVWVSAFASAYVVLVVPSSVRERLLVHALEDVSVVVIIGLLSAAYVRVDSRAVALSEAVARAPAGAEKLAIREGLRRALPPMEISLDVLLAASREGLTVIQAELLAYLVLGLTNREIADATKVSEATVRYRLTRLYRVLGVRGRRAAIERAHEIGGAGGFAAAER